jgi:ribonuclease HII
MAASWVLEAKLWQKGYGCIAGVDEAGRGALAGPVVAAAVVLPFKTYPFQDSKVLSAALRVEMAETIKREALGWAVGLASPGEVDELNVLRATQLAAQRALEQLALPPAALVTDYLKLDMPYPVLAVVKADAQSSQVAAASILAKTARDQLMASYHQSYPQYGFAGHKGYGSVKHLAALEEHGPCAIHRFSFRPVAQRSLF